MANWVKLRAYARHRGVTLAAVQKAIKDQRVTAVLRNEKGWLVRIDQDAADLQWVARTDPAEAAKNGQVLTMPARHPEFTGAPGAPLPTGPIASVPGAPGANFSGAPLGPISGRAEETASAPDQGASPDELALDVPAVAQPAAPKADDEFGYHQARAARERYAAKDAELSYLERVGTLVPAADVRAMQFEVFRKVRDGLMLVPDRICHRVASETDPVQVHRVMTEATREVLSELSRAFTADAARGAGQRVDAVS